MITKGRCVHLGHGGPAPIMGVTVNVIGVGGMPTAATTTNQEGFWEIDVPPNHMVEVVYGAVLIWFQVGPDA